MVADERMVAAELEEMPPLYHWSPWARRGQIKRYGLRPGMRTTISSAGWRPPYVCLAETPSWAWALSGMRDEHKPRQAGIWDLWQVNVNGLTGELIESFDRQHQWHEVRVRERIYKRRVLYLATREVAYA